MLPYLTLRTHAHATLCPALRPPVSAPHPAPHAVYAQPAAPPHHRTCCTIARSAHTRRTAAAHPVHSASQPRTSRHARMNCALPAAANARHARHTSPLLHTTSMPAPPRGLAPLATHATCARPAAHLTSRSACRAPSAVPHSPHLTPCSHNPPHDPPHATHAAHPAPHATSDAVRAPYMTIVSVPSPCHALHHTPHMHNLPHPPRTHAPLCIPSHAAYATHPAPCPTR